MGVSVARGVRVRRACRVLEGVAVAVGDDSVGVPVAFLVGLVVGLGDMVTVAVGVRLRVAEGDEVSVAVALCVGVEDDVAVGGRV